MTIDEIKNRIGIRDLSEMQTSMFDAFSSGKNIRLLSPTGTGKTFAYMIPLVFRLTNQINASSENLPQKPGILVICPSRELVLQSTENWKKFNSGHTAVALYGGNKFEKEKAILKQTHPTIIIATPGRLLDHIKRDESVVENIRLLVLDEFDKCLELGFQEEMSGIFLCLSRIERFMLISATNIDDISLVNPLNNKNTVTLDFLQTTNSADKQQTFLLKQPNGVDKSLIISSLINTIVQKESDKFCKIIVFTATREETDRVGQQMIKEFSTVSTYHGGLEQEMREINLFKFEAGVSRILVTTDLAARGLDFSGVRHIIQTNIPNKEDEFVHRIGRTARWNTSGNTYLIYPPNLSIPDYLKSYSPQPYALNKSHISDFSETQWKSLYISKGKNAHFSKSDILGFLCKNLHINKNKIGKILVLQQKSFVAVHSSVLANCLSSNLKIKGTKVQIKLSKL